MTTDDDPFTDDPLPDWIERAYENFRKMREDPEDGEMSVDYDRVLVEHDIQPEDFAGWPVRLYESTVYETEEGPWLRPCKIVFGTVTCEAARSSLEFRMVFEWDAVEGRWRHAE